MSGSYEKIKFDTALPPCVVWAIDVDAVCMDLGSETHYDLSDHQAIYGLRRMRNRLKARLDAIDRDLERLVERNKPSEHADDELTVTMARAERYMREKWPRELEIALTKAGINEVNK